MQKKPLKELIRLHEWWIVGSVAVIAALLGALGFYQYFSVRNQERTIIDLFYLSWQLFTSQSGAVTGEVPFPLQVARWLAPAVVIYAAIKGVLAVTREHITILRLRAYKTHIVVCGLGQKGLRLVADFIARKQRIVIIESNAMNDELATLKEEKGIITLIGEATDMSLLRKARVPYASRLIAVTGDDQANIEIAIKANELKKKNGNGSKLSCHVHVFNMRIRHLFDGHELFTQHNKNFDAQLFNVFEKNARLIFEDFSPDKIIPVPQPGSPQVHILVVGFGWMGESLVLQAIRTGHYANDKNMRLTIIDKEVDRKSARFYNNYPGIKAPPDLIAEELDKDLADLEFKELDIEVLSQTDFKKLQEGFPPFAVCFVCVGSDEVWNLSIASRLRKLFGQDTPPIVVCMSQKTGISELINSEELKKKENIHLFNMIDRACGVEQVINEELDIKAKTIHECFCEARLDEGGTPEKNSSLRKWEELPELSKDSNRCSADHIAIKLRAVSCDQEKRAVTTYSNFLMMILQYLREWNIADGWLKGSSQALH